MPFEFLAATRLPMATLMAIGAAGALVIAVWSFSNWRAAVKVAFVVALLEGAIRKWGLPQGQELVYFLKDVFLFGAYVKFFFAPELEMRSHRLRIPGFFIFMVCLIVSLSALHPNINSAILSVFGLKVYFYYVPLIFMMPHLFRSEPEMIRQLTWYALLAVPICLLGLAQWGAGGDSPLNVYAQGGEEGVSGFGYGTDKVRITGTFSYITGHTTFVNFFVALCLVVLTAREVRWRWLIVGVALPLLAANAMMGGSRAAIYVAGFVVAGMAVAAFSGRIGRGTNLRTILVVAIAIGTLAVSYLFYDAFLHMSQRTKYAGDTFYERTLLHLVDAMSEAVDKGGFTGRGIGLTHPATSALKNFLRIDGPKEMPVGVESEPGQVWLEVGAIGFFAWYALRLMLVWLCWRSYRDARSDFQRALGLAAFLLSIPYMIMGVVLNHTANLLLFGLYGLAMLPRLEPVVKMRHHNTRNGRQVPGNTSVQSLPRTSTGRG